MSAPALDRRSDYVSAVAVELGDLAPDDRAELIEELDDHVAALLDDRPGTDLIDALGTPRAYAAELRAAAGLTGTGPTPLPLRARVRAAAVRAEAAAPWLRPFLAMLRPAWWVLRGVVAALAVVSFFGWSGSSAQGVVLLVVGVVGSMWLAQRPRSTPRFRRGVLVLNVAVVLAVLWVAAFRAPFAGAGVVQVQYDTQYVPNCPIELSNLYGYDAQGRPLDGVRLYDQNGNPFDVSVFGCSGGQFAPDGAANVYPYPSATVDDYGTVPTGPPASLAPLPGATVPGATVSNTPLPGAAVSDSAAAGATPTPTAPVTPVPSATP